MNGTAPESRFRIKPIGPGIVKRAVLLASVLSLASSSLTGLSGCARTRSEKPGPDELEVLPRIEVLSGTVTVDQHTASAAVYLLTLNSGDLPAPGRIVLLKQENTKIMAFRVLRLYPEQKQFAGRKVRVYDNHPELDRGQTFTALQKLGDVGEYAGQPDDLKELNELEAASGLSASTPDELPQPAEAQQPKEAPAPRELTQAEIDEIFGVIPEYDPELDVESSPPPRGAVDSTTDGVSSEFTAEGVRDDNLDLDPVSVEEITPLEPNPFSLTAEFGYMRNADGSSFPAGGARFSFRLARMIFLKNPIVQDEIGGEFGTFLYKAILTETDVFTVIPLVPTLRYTVHLSEEFSVYGYAGAVQNVVLPAEGYDPELLAVMQTVLPAFGAGLLFRIGPSWEARVDLGYDIVGLGLVIGF